MTEAGARRSFAAAAAVSSSATEARGTHRVLEVRDLSAGAFVLRFSRESLAFRAGQWVSLGLPGSRDSREYTVYSSPGDPFLEVLVREIPQGRVSRALRRCRPGDALRVDGPFGAFTLDESALGASSFTPDESAAASPALFVATGTGVSPFRCFARTFPALDYRLLHGVGDASELYGREAFDPARHIACLSRTPNAGPARSDGNAFAGRVTAYLAEHPVEASSFCYLCGNSDMIYEIFAILRNQGVPRSRIFAEVYF